jgi:hypothetical protein
MGNDDELSELWNILRGHAEKSLEREKQIEKLLIDGPIDYSTAVEFTAQRLRDVFKVGAKSDGAAFYEAQLYYREYLSEDPSDQEVACLTKKARTDFRAYRVLLLLHLIKNDFTKHLPSLIQWKIQLDEGIYTPPRKPPGPSKVNNVHRNTLIVSQINYLVRLKFDVTRNKATSGGSACDVIVDAFKSLGIHYLTYAAIESVWQQREEIPQPTLLKEAIEQYFGMCEKG